MPRVHRHTAPAHVHGAADLITNYRTVYGVDGLAGLFTDVSRMVEVAVHAIRDSPQTYDSFAARRSEHNEGLARLLADARPDTGLYISAHH